MFVFVLIYLSIYFLSFHFLLMFNRFLLDKGSEEDFSAMPSLVLGLCVGGGGLMCLAITSRRKSLGEECSCFT